MSGLFLLAFLPGDGDSAAVFVTQYGRSTFAQVEIALADLTVIAASEPVAGDGAEFFLPSPRERGTLSEIENMEAEDRFIFFRAFR